MNTLCDDGKACTTDSCKPIAGESDSVTGCVHTPVDTNCNNGIGCTTDICNPSSSTADAVTGCVYTPLDSYCDDENASTTDSCTPLAPDADPLTGCIHTSTTSNLCPAGFVFNSIASAPGAVRLNTISSCDDCTELVNLPFTFQWLGLHPISKVRISSNAHININADDTISHWQRAYPIVNGEVMVEPYISMAQTDIDRDQGGSVYALYKADPPQSHLVSFENYNFYASGGSVNVQAELFPNGNVNICFGRMESSGSYSVAIGLQDDNRSVWLPAVDTFIDPNGIVTPAQMNNLDGNCYCWTF